MKKINKLKLDKKEKQILRDFEIGKFSLAPNHDAVIRRHAAIAKATLAKTKTFTSAGK